MGETQSLMNLEGTANEAYQAYNEASEAVTAAAEKTAAAQKAYDEAMNKYGLGNPTEENRKLAEEAQKALEAAKAEEKAATEALEAAADEAQKAVDAVEAKKEELRKNRHKDTTYVVHCARIECKYGMRESYLALGPTHGVITRQVPQMTAKDTVLDTNIINFGGCKSMENPTLRAAAEEAARKANETIEAESSWGDKFVDAVTSFFCGDQEIEVTESLMEECMGECIACFPENAEWIRGHKKVFINGEAVLLRRCSLRCNYGGLITILLSGQPE